LESFFHHSPFTIHRFLLFAVSIAISIAVSIAASGCRFARQDFPCYGAAAK
jgi:hypothetical protein